MGAPLQSGPAGVLALQRAVGNAALARLVGASRHARPLGAPASRHAVLARSPLNGDAVVAKRIGQARRNNPTIRFGEVHPAVRRLQERLAELGFEPAFSRRSDGTFDGGFGKGTRDAVEDYQANAEIDVDGIVGRDTIGKLEQPDGGLKPRPAPAPKTKVDVIVKYTGVLRNPRDLSENEVYPDHELTTYRAKPGRKLERFGKTTTTIGDASRSLIGEHVAKIQAALAGKDPGKIVIYGSSSGGRNALDLAVSLSNRGIPIVLIADLDAAWFPDDAINPPDQRFAPTVVPLFKTDAPVSAKDKRSYFQTRGNHAKATTRGLRWTSDLNDEIHGRVLDFAGEDLSLQVSENAADDQAHIRLINVALPVVHKRIRAILDGP